MSCKAARPASRGRANLATCGQRNRCTTRLWLPFVQMSGVQVYRMTFQPQTRPAKPTSPFTAPTALSAIDLSSHEPDDPTA